MSLPGFHRPPGGRLPPLSRHESTFLDLAGGNSISCSKQYGTEFVYYIRHLTRDIRDQCKDILDQTFHPNEDDFQRLILLFCHIIQVYHVEVRSLQRLSEVLDQQRVIRSDVDVVAKKRFLFSALGSLSLLYRAEHATEGYLNIETRSIKIFSRSCVPIDLAHRPLDELFTRLGAVLPSNRISRNHTEESISNKRSNKFRVSMLNASAITEIGRIRIEWVDIVGAHLSFDPEGPTVYLFRLPFFCKLQQSEDSILPIICRGFLAGEENLNPNFTIPALMKEIILSYSLLFKDDRAARILYQKSERAKAALQGVHLRDICVDPILDEACGFGLSASVFTFGQPVRDTYNSDSDFPILQGRLNYLRDYMEGIEPSRLVSLWKDRRDLRLWYTVWIVILFGGIGIIQQAVSIVLSAVQIAIAFRALELQRNQM